MLPMTDDQIHARGLAMQGRLDDARALLIGRTILRAEDYYLPGGVFTINGKPTLCNC